MSIPLVTPELIVVGAGPGDPELITVKAQKALQRAAVILYDNLANKELLSLAPVTCETIYVGKMPYGDYTPQETIHALIKEKALEKGTVVRLKGGDPYIFGRGFEEILFAREHGLLASYIPGITSMQGLGYEDIPLTHRSVSDGFWVMNAARKDDSLIRDLEMAVRSKVTVVIYMGVKRLSEIAEVYRTHGAGTVPAAILQHITLPRKKVIKSTISQLPQLATEQEISHPALIVIGPVVSLSGL